MARSKTSGNWLKEHHSDPYVLKAREEGYRSRAVYKLKEIQERDKIIRKGMVVVELGAAPGGWSQYVAGILAGSGKMIALDILPMDSLADVHFIQGDFREPSVLDELLRCIGENQKVDLIISDMAPNMSGVRTVDQAKSMYLAELAWDFVQQCLVENGTFLTKVFHGVGFDNYLRELRKYFKTVHSRKPDASRARSQETYLLACGYRGIRK